MVRGEKSWSPLEKKVHDGIGVKSNQHFEFSISIFGVYNFNILSL